MLQEPSSHFDSKVRRSLLWKAAISVSLPVPSTHSDNMFAAY